MRGRTVDGAVHPAPATRVLGRWTLFAGSWGWVLLMHQATFDRWQYSPLGWALCALAMGLVLWPASLPLLAATVLVDAAYAFQCLPGTANHLVFEGLMCATWSVALLLHAVGVLRRGGRLRELLAWRAGEPHPLEASRAPLRAALLGVYWLSVLHKLNYDFVDPATSCASYMYGRVAELLPFLPRAVWAEHVAIWGTLLAEAALPVLLMSRRTWQLGLVAALSFHLMLAFDPTPGIYSFTGLLFALFILILPGAFIDVATTWLGALLEQIGPRRARALRAAGLVLVAAILAHGTTRTDDWAFHTAFYVFFLPWAGVVIAGYLLCLARLAAAPVSKQAPTSLPAPNRGSLAPAAALWALPCLVLLNGLNPYLGLRTQLSFSMFSNLRTEGGISNHLFMPKLASLTNYQDDLVEILDSDDADLAEYPNEQLLLPYFELRRLVSGLDDVRVRYRRGGAEHTYVCTGGHCNDPELAQPFSPLLGRLLYFRPVDKGPHMLCRH